MKHTFEITALNLNDVMVTLRVEAKSEDEARAIVTKKNKYLRIQTVTDLSKVPEQEAECQST